MINGLIFWTPMIKRKKSPHHIAVCLRLCLLLKLLSWQQSIHNPGSKGFETVNLHVLERKSSRSTSARHNPYKNEEGMKYLYDVRRWWWWLGSGVWKGEGSGAKPVSRLPGHGSDASKRSEICSLRAHWPVRLTITYYSTVPADKATSYTSTFQTGISITLLTPNVF